MGYALANTGNFLLNIVFGIFITLVLLRLLMQYFRTSFSNPVGQFIIRTTNFMVMPLRRIISPLGNLDSASLVLAFLMHMLFIVVAALLIQQDINLIQILIWSTAGLLTMTMSIYTPLIFINMLASWLPDLRYQPAIQVIGELVDPIIDPFRRILPNMGGIDFSPIIPLLVIYLLKVFLSSLPMLNSYFILGL